MWVLIGDFNGDGKLDLATFYVSFSILLQDIPSVTLSPDSLTFEPQLSGTSSNPQPVTLTNVGAARLKIGEIVKIFDRANFAKTNDCPSTIPAGGQCTINVSFAPQGRGSRTGAVAIIDNAPASPQKISLTESARW